MCSPIQLPAHLIPLFLFFLRVSYTCFHYFFTSILFQTFTIRQHVPACHWNFCQHSAPLAPSPLSFPWPFRRLLRAPWTARRSNQSIGRTDAEAEAPILWPPYAKSRFIGKDSDVGKDWRQEEKRTTEDEMAGWHHPLNGHEFEQILGDIEGQRGLACYSSWGHKESGHDWVTEQQQCATYYSVYFAISNSS